MWVVKLPGDVGPLTSTTAAKQTLPTHTITSAHARNASDNGERVILLCCVSLDCALLLITTTVDTSS